MSTEARRAELVRMDWRTRLFCAVVDRAGLMRVDRKTPAQLVEMRRRDARSTRRLGWLLGRTTPGVGITPAEVPGPAGTIPVRVYRPQGGTARRPVVVVFHGGGWVTGTLDQYDPLCSAISAGIRPDGAVVLSVDYRLAPDFPFPAAFEDAWAATAWAVANAERLGAGSGRVAVVGDSAGGNLAAAVTLAARDRDVPLSAQVLVYPATDLRADSELARDRREAPLLTVAARDAYTAYYVADADRTDLRLSPAAAPDLSGLPPALVQTAEHDPLRTDGRRYADRLRAAGVRVRYTDYLGVPHGFLSIPGICRQAAQAQWEIIEFLSGM